METLFCVWKTDSITACQRQRINSLQLFNRRHGCQRKC